MQDKYVGDIGDFAKYSLLRSLSYDIKLGVSWYLISDEENNDGRHIDYLKCPEKWRRFDETTYDVLQDVVESDKRRVCEIENRNLLPGTTFFSRRLDFQGCRRSKQAEWRKAWFSDSVECLKDCGLIFVDPDNGLRRSDTFRPGQRKHAKSISEAEAQTLAIGERPVVIYHHNTRFPGGHDAEVHYWQKRLGERTCAAVRWRKVSARTFFILNCTNELAQRAEDWCKRWDTSRVALLSPPP